jgi:lipopolysaccharide assembly outer membrane protein LptD (OstA)
MRNKSHILSWLKSVVLTLALFSILGAGFAWAETAKDSPMIINGDNVEYSADSKEVVATGNIEVIYHGSKLTCNRLKVDMQSKEAQAEGNAKIEDARGIVTGDKIVYDFEQKNGIIYNADFRANPYFGKARKVEKLGDTAFISKYGYFTTCNLDHPHYRFASKKISLYPQDKMQAERTTFYLWKIPLLYLPRFNYSMKEPIMHVQVEPGSRKDWGLYLLSTWRYNLTENSNLRLFLDYRTKLGLGEGFDLNYKSPGTGRGDFKFYFANENYYNPPAGAPTEFQRYFLRWRHKWNIDPRTNLIAEFYKISDKRRQYENNPAPNPNAHNILQDYFFREYERDSQPLTYALFHHAFNYSSLDVILQKRTNHWFDQLDKLPEINYSLPSLQIGETPFYFENSSQFGVYNKKATTLPVSLDDVTMTRLDTTNTLALPMRLGFLRVKPYVASRQTFYDQGENGKSSIVRTIFYGGTDLSTKFFRIYNTKANFMGLEINGLRHIITPSIKYLYTHEPTVPISNLRQIDAVDAITRGNTATLSLSNKLQTKRNGVSVDFVDLLISTDYVLSPKSGVNQNSILNNPGSKLESQFSDILFKLKILPYSWVRLESEATFEHSDHTSPNYNKFSLANYTLNFDISKERSFSIGQRYARKSYNEVTASFTWRISPKWKFGIYQRYNIKQTSTLDKGYQEQQYTLTRDLHCWDLDISLNRKEDTGTTVYFTFRLKAFPENEFGFDQQMSESKSGSQ